MHDAKEKITIVGAGLVGSLLATVLARRGYEVQVLERRADMRRESVGAGRSINLAVSVRGLHALREIGLEEEVLKKAIPMRGRMIHPVLGEVAFQRYGKDDSECINSISRAELNKSLMTFAEQTGKVALRFQRKVLGMNFDTGALHLRDELSGEENAEIAELVIGTDGSASALRYAMQTIPGGTHTESLLDYGYKELAIPAGPGGTFLLEKHALHIWPRGTYMLIALPNFDGSFTCTLFLPFEGQPGFDRLKTPQSVSEFFLAQFPDVVPLIPSLTDQFFENPTGHMVTVKCSPWHVGGKALILGDAAHAIVPFFGQGMNAGFEDVTYLTQAIDAALASAKSIPWDEVFAEFGRTRKPDTDAIADMAVENFVEMRDKVGDPNFLLAKEVEKVLQRVFPGEYHSRYALVTFSRVPYRVAQKVGEIDDAILAELTADISSPSEVDLEKAAKLIRTRLTPVPTS